MPAMGQGEHGDDLLAELLDLAAQIGLEVRHAPLGGAGGGLARLRGREILFVDTDADGAVQLEKTAAALSRLAPRLEGIYIKPAIRAMIEPGGS